MYHYSIANVNAYVCYAGRLIRCCLASKEQQITRLQGLEIFKRLLARNIFCNIHTVSGLALLGSIPSKYVTIKEIGGLSQTAAINSLYGSAAPDIRVSSKLLCSFNNIFRRRICRAYPFIKSNYL